MAYTVSKSKFKPRALEYFRKIQESREPLIVTDRKQPVLKIIPYSEEPEDSLKILRHSVLKYENPTEPVGLEDWESLE